MYLWVYPKVVISFLGAVVCGSSVRVDAVFDHLTFQIRLKLRADWMKARLAPP